MSADTPNVSESLKAERFLRYARLSRKEDLVSPQKGLDGLFKRQDLDPSQSILLSASRVLRQTLKSPKCTYGRKTTQTSVKLLK